MDTPRYKQCVHKMESATCWFEGRCVRSCATATYMHVLLPVQCFDQLLVCILYFWMPRHLGRRGSVQCTSSQSGSLDSYWSCSLSKSHSSQEPLRRMCTWKANVTMCNPNASPSPWCTCPTTDGSRAWKARKGEDKHPLHGDDFRPSSTKGT